MGKNNLSAPLYALTIEEFTTLLDERIKTALSSATPTKQAGAAYANQVSQGRFVYGLRGIEQLFGVSHKTAQYYKDNIIQDAVKQNGRKIVVDVEKALQLFNDRNSK